MILGLEEVGPAIMGRDSTGAVKNVLVATDGTMQIGASAGTIPELGGILTATESQLAVSKATHTSPNDFTAAYTSATTITLTGYPSDLTADEQIVYILQLKNDNTYDLFVNGRNCRIAFSGGVLTLHGAGTPFVTGDAYRIGIRVQDKAYDSSQNTLMTTEQSPEKDWYTDPVTLVSEQDLTTSEADFGSVIDVRAYKILILYIAGDVNDSEDCTLYAYTLPTVSGSEYTSQDAGFSSSVTLWSGAGTDFLHEYRLDVEAHAFIQLKAKVDTLGGTAGDLSIMIAKRY